MLASTGVTLTVLTGTVAAAAAPAANADTNDCLLTRFCYWNDYGYTGSMYDNDHDVWFVGVIPNDEATSVYNHGRMSNIVMYSDWNFTGDETLFVKKGSRIYNLVDYDFNDKMSSFEWVV
ncbi:hypothetical protein BH09ACT6_BH09ACT6_11880 [soil metagenome]